MLAVKGNMEYTIEESAKGSFVKEGFDIYDDQGNIIEYGAGKVIPIGKYVELLESFEALSKENEDLRKALARKGADTHEEEASVPKKPRKASRKSK